MSSASSPRGQVASSGLDLLVNEYHAYLLRNADDSVAGREDLFEKMEGAGFRIGRRYAERCVAAAARRHHAHVCARGSATRIAPPPLSPPLPPPAASRATRTG